MCLSYLSVLSPFSSTAKMSFLRWWGGGGGGLTSGTYFFDLLLLFLKNALLSLLFHSKMSFTRKNPEFFPCSFGFYKLSNNFFRSTLQNINFLVLTPKGSLFSLYYCHSYYPAYLAWNLFLTTHCDKFNTCKALLSLLFTSIIPTFSLLFPNFYRYFFGCRALESLGGGLKSRGVICISMWLVGWSPLTLASQQVGHVLIVPIK